MEALKFDPALHLEMIRNWSSDRGLGPVPPNMLPKTGRIIPGVCAIFLYKTDSDIGFLENLISNPRADKKVASQGIDLCISAIEKDAKELGVALLWSTTCISGVVERAERLGFHVQKRVYKLILKGI